MMKRISAKTRIAIGQVCILVSVLFLAMILGLVPDRRGAVMAARALVPPSYFSLTFLITL